MAARKRTTRRKRVTRKRTTRRRTTKRRTTKRRSTRRTVRRRRRRKQKIRRGSKRRVWSGTADQTTRGLEKNKLMKNKRGKVVSKKQYAKGVTRYKKLRPWVNAFMKARKNLKIKGFVPCKKGSKLYKETRKIWKGE